MNPPRIKPTQPGQGAELRAAVKSYFPAILCALTPAFCYLLIRPYAEIGMDDDWSYIKTAQIFAQTGHIAYNGWGEPMLGWQLYLAALLVRLFGFSFTAVRSGTAIVFTATAFLLQRSMVRAGVREWNATLATLTFILSPLCLPLAFTFMNDVYGAFCVVLCLYMCLRALQAETLSTTVAWISLAALLNAIGGTARQTAWFGLLVMVPSTLWLLRRKRRVLLIGGLACAAGIGIVFAAMRWQSQQPYTIHSPIMPRHVDREVVKAVAGFVLYGLLDLSLLLLPVLLMFPAAFRKFNRRMAVGFAAGCLFFALLSFYLFSHSGPDHKLRVFMMRAVTFRGLSGIEPYSSFVMGHGPFILHDGVRLLLTGAAIIGLVGLLTVFFGNAPGRASTPDSAVSISWQNLGVVIGPFTAAYLALLLLRASNYLFFNRYLLPLMIVSLIVLTRYYQEKVGPNLPIASAILVVIIGCFGVAATHDEFAECRGFVAAVDEIRSSGLPATAITAGAPYDGWTEIDKAGYVNNPAIRIPPGAYVPLPEPVLPADCDKFYPDWTPAIKPLYALSFDPGLCNGPAGFPPVIFRSWLPPHVTLVYIVKAPDLSGK